MKTLLKFGTIKVIWKNLIFSHPLNVSFNRGPKFCFKMVKWLFISLKNHSLSAFRLPLKMSKLNWNHHRTLGTQWLSGRVLDLRPKGRGLEPHGCHCVVSLSKNINPSLVLIQPRKTRLFITERLLMERKESNKIKNKIIELEQKQE